MSKGTLRNGSKSLPQIKKKYMSPICHVRRRQYLTDFLLQTMILKVFFIQGNGLAHVSYVDPTKFMFSIGIELSSSLQPKVTFVWLRCRVRLV